MPGVDLPEGYVARRARRDDLDDWVRVCQAVDDAETGEVDYDEAIVREEWDRPRFSLERDAWVVVAPSGDVVAHAHAWDVLPGARVIAESYVLPELAALLEAPVLDLSLAEGERLARASGAGDVGLQTGCVSSNTRRSEALTRRGFTAVRHFLRMRLDLTTPARPAPSTTATLRAYDPERDERAFHAVQMAAFADHWGEHDESIEEWRAGFVDVPAYDPSLWSVAEMDGAIVGMIVGRPDLDGKGWVRSVGVLPEHRGRGIGEALLLRAFEQFRERGWQRAELGVDAENSTGATRLYDRVGMHAAFVVDMWERRVSAHG
jgi:ribosomal protein S18 acetylase RimI-like enzyme